MSDIVEVPVSGNVKTNVLVNVRQGLPSTAAPLLRKLGAGTKVQVFALVVGDSIQGNAHWFRISDNTYIWAGGCSELLQSTATPQAEPIANSQGRHARLSQVPLVIDISHGDGVDSFQNAKNSGLVGVIHKATTGETGKDDAYTRRRDSAVAAGLLWGAYHWGTAASVQNQVKNFMDWAKPNETTLVALDFESTLDNQMTLDGAREFCEQIYTRLGRRPVIYSGDTLKSALGSVVDTFFSEHRLWLAQYGNNPRVQNSWDTFWLWQYTDGDSGPPSCRTVTGITGDSKKRLDCNYFEGDAATLASQWAS
ncbi:glycosyl hydrolases 25 family protein [Pseudomonas fluorescens]|uniref:Glycosyl hydrolases 25 family protein n=1 Tax=Pseudomonas fluorescens TaxID=294 RepID=A0A0N8NXT2_PSEFL|nr:glycoside hydrolase family 25 protein [Pseudomonas fluorescens]KPU61073.1 glycosyl hydrolases 25 family protein [Pseudomonas fluorescens]